MAECWYERTHGAANSAPLWTWRDFVAWLGEDKAGVLT